jgi:hypothetical protein
MASVKRIAILIRSTDPHLSDALARLDRNVQVNNNIMKEETHVHPMHDLR